jgi:heterodisulfide reductase subunit B
MMYPDDLSPAASYVPGHMDLILAALGARSVDYSRRFLCCGSALGLNVDPLLSPWLAV